MTSILIAFSDTGGGHRAAAIAIRDAIAQARTSSDVSVDVQLVDPFALTARWPFHRLGAHYPRVIERAPWIWRAGFACTNTHERAALLQRMAWPMVRSTFASLAAQHSPDVIVSTHPLLTSPLRRAFPDTPIIVVVTDLVSGHVSWYQRDVDLMIVPTREARDRAVQNGVPKSSVQVLGVPVSQQFVAVPGERSELQSRLGWSTSRPTVLLAGGAEGIGGLDVLASAIDQAELPCDVAVVAGRNSALATALRTHPWRSTVHVYDFVSNFAELMRAASVLITKAGPGTISEACASGCPMILSGAIPGQETGNVEFVTRGRAGVWAPSPLAVTAALHAWLIGRDAPAALRRASGAALRLALPNAAHDIAHEVLTVAARTAADSGDAVEPALQDAAA